MVRNCEDFIFISYLALFKFKIRFRNRLKKIKGCSDIKLLQEKVSSKQLWFPESLLSQTKIEVSLLRFKSDFLFPVIFQLLSRSDCKEIKDHNL